MSSRTPDTPVDPTVSDRHLPAAAVAELDTWLEHQLRRLRRWARGRLPSSARGDHDTSDIVQEALVRTIARLDLFRPSTRGALSAYLRAAVRHRIVDAHRRAARWGLETLDEAVRSEDPSPLAQAIDAETRRRYRTALASLARRDQELIVGYLELDYSHAQLGCMIGRSPHAARMALTRAMARLAERMDPA